MDKHSLEVCTPIADPAMQTQPLLNFGAGYIQRSVSGLPRQGDAFPWLTSFHYAADAKLLRKGKVDDKNLRFTPKRSEVTA